MKRVKKLSKKIIFAIVCASVIGFILLCCFALWIDYLFADRIECWRPDYGREDLAPVLAKSELTDGDYDLLFKQTGVTKTGIDRMLARGDDGKERILSIQNDYFEEHAVSNKAFGFLVCTDYLDRHMTHCYLENGDVIVTSSTHFAGWRMGHAGLVTNASRDEVLQSGVAGETSKVEWMTDFTDRVNFMILSPKVDTDIKNEVVDYALNNLIGIPFSALTGIFTDKNKLTATHCSHLVWYAYNHCGIDLDSNGGGLVTSRDLFRSEDMEIIQIFGFDPETLWGNR